MKTRRYAILILLIGISAPVRLFAGIKDRLGRFARLIGNASGVRPLVHALHKDQIDEALRRESRRDYARASDRSITDAFMIFDGPNGTQQRVYVGSNIQNGMENGFVFVDASKQSTIRLPEEFADGILLAGEKLFSQGFSNEQLAKMITPVEVARSDHGGMAYRTKMGHLWFRSQGKKRDRRVTVRVYVEMRMVFDQSFPFVI